LVNYLASKIVVASLIVIVAILCITQIAMFYNRPTVTVYPPTKSTLPADNFRIKLIYQELINLTSGYPFTVGIVSYDIYGNETSGFNGTLYLSVQNGSVIPSSVPIINGVWVGRLTVNATDTIFIIADDRNGTKGTTCQLIFHTLP
jgi:hypothetical protein